MRCQDYTYEFPKFKPYEFPQISRLEETLDKCYTPGYSWSKQLDP